MDQISTGHDAQRSDRRTRFPPVDDGDKNLHLMTTTAWIFFSRWRRRRSWRSEPSPSRERESHRKSTSTALTERQRLNVLGDDDNRRGRGLVALRAETDEERRKKTHTAFAPLAQRPLVLLVRRRLPKPSRRKESLGRETWRRRELNGGVRCGWRLSSLCGEEGALRERRTRKKEKKWDAQVIEGILVRLLWF